MAWGKNYYRDNHPRKQYYGHKKFYDNRNRFWAVVCLVASATVCTLPWMTLEFFGETLGGISLYTAASHIESLQALFNTYHLFGVSDFTMANVSVTLTGVSLLAGLIVVLFWRRLAGLSWLCGVLNIAAAGVWILFMQNLPMYANTALGGLGIGIGCWAYLVIGAAWIYIGYRVSGSRWF